MGQNKILVDNEPISGMHCESSAMANAMIFQGYMITEEQIIGAGAAPGFVYERSTFPFLGGRSHRMKECFSKICGIPYQIIENPGNPCWNGIENLLNNRIPVILRVDMRYLPYLFNGKFGPHYMSFGWHYITLFELDRKNKSAKVSDTSHSELQSIKLSALEKARFSKTKVYPPNGEYYYFHKPDDSFSIDWTETAQSSLKQYYQNMREGSVHKKQLSGLVGLKQLDDEITRLHKSVPSYLVGTILDFHYGCIEINGTGGAAFRTMYYQFLVKHLHCNNRDVLLTAAQRCEQTWHHLADAYKAGASIYKKGSKERKKEISLNISDSAKNVFAAESEMNNLIKETYSL